MLNQIVDVAQHILNFVVDNVRLWNEPGFFERSILWLVGFEWSEFAHCGFVNWFVMFGWHIRNINLVILLIFSFGTLTFHLW
jgi:hypothetical protein